MSTILSGVFNLFLNVIHLSIQWLKSFPMGNGVSLWSFLLVGTLITSLIAIFVKRRSSHD